MSKTNKTNTKKVSSTVSCVHDDDLPFTLNKTLSGLPNDPTWDWLDNALDVSRFALPEQRNQAQRQRRIGIGVTGVADAIAMLGAKYGSSKAVFQPGSAIDSSKARRLPPLLKWWDLLRSFCG